jgi:hypothetical protein
VAGGACDERSYGTDAVPKKPIVKWFQRFRKANESWKTEKEVVARLHRNITRPRTLIRANGRLNIQVASEKTVLTFGSVQGILSEDLNVGHVGAKFVPRMLIEDQNEERGSTSSTLFDRSVSDPTLLQKVITGEKSWVYRYKPETRTSPAQT